MSPKDLSPFGIGPHFCTGSNPASNATPRTWLLQNGKYP